jgi:ADP-ribose pyrophosphatase YjhB (NUDIX family)
VSLRDQPSPLHLWADEIRSIANEQLYYGPSDDYTRGRCDRLIRIAAELAAITDVRAPNTIEALYQGDLTHITPYCGGDAAIFDAHGRILLIQRDDNRLWAMPGGAFEIGETPAEGTCREAREETGLDVDPIKLSGVYDSRRAGTRLPFHLYHFVFLCRPRDTNAQPRLSNETLDVRWYQQNQLPPLSPGHQRRILDAFRRLTGELPDAVFDS